MKSLVYLFFALSFSSSLAQSSFENAMWYPGPISGDIAEQYFSQYSYYQLSPKERLPVNSVDLFLLVSMSDGVCYREGLFVFTPEGEMLETIEVAQICDHDGSSASYKQKELVNVYTPDFLIVVKDQVEKVTDGEKLGQKEGQMAPEWSFHDDDVSKQKEVSFSYYGLDEFGRLVQFCEQTRSSSARQYGFVSCELLKPDQLYRYSPRELRLMRNEVFAARGYIFKSPDLRAYFGK